MKLAILLLSLTGFAIASLNEVLVRHPGGIGGIFKGPNLETIVKGPDGSVITSQQEGAEVRTDLEAIAGGAVVPDADTVVPVAGIADAAIPAPLGVGTGLEAGVSAAAPVAISVEPDVAAVPRLPPIAVRGPARILRRRLRPLISPGSLGQSPIPTIVSSAVPASPRAIAVPTDDWGQIDTVQQGFDVQGVALPSSTLSPIELDLPPITRNLELEAVRVDSATVAGGNLGLSGNVELAGVDVSSIRLPTSTYSPLEVDLSSLRGNVRLSSNSPVGLNSGNVPLSQPNVISVVSSTYSPSELDLSPARGDLKVSNAATVSETLSRSNVASPIGLSSTYSPLGSTLSSGRGNLRLLNNAPVDLNSGNVPSSQPNVISVLSSTYSPSESDLSSNRGNLRLLNEAQVSDPLSRSNVASPIGPSLSYSPLGSTLSSGRGNLRLLDNAPVGPSQPNVIPGVSSTYSPSELELTPVRGNFGVSTVSETLSRSNVASPIGLSSTYSPLGSTLSSGRGNLRLLNAPVDLNSGNVPLSQPNVISVLSSTYSPNESDLSSNRGSLRLLDEAPVSDSLSRSNVASPIGLSSTYSPLGSTLSSGKGNLRLLNSAPVDLNSGNVPLSQPNVISVVSSTYSPNESDLSSNRGNLRLLDEAPVSDPFARSNVASPIGLSSTYSPLGSTLSSGRGNLRLLNNAPVDLNSGNVPLSQPNVISVVSSTYSPIESDLSSNRGNLRLLNEVPVSDPLSRSNVASSGRGNLRLLNNAPVDLNTGNVPLSQPNVISVVSSTYSPSEESSVRGNLRLLNEAPVVVTSGNVPLSGSNVAPTELPTSAYQSLEPGDGPSNVLLPETGAGVWVSSFTPSPVDLSSTLRVRNGNLPLPNAIPIAISPPTRLPPSINVQRSNVPQTLSNGNLLLPNNQIQDVSYFPRGQPTSGLESVSPVAFPINDDRISSTQVPPLTLGSTLPPNLLGDRGSSGQLLLDPLTIPARNVIPPEIGLAGPRGSGGDEESRGRLYYDNGGGSGGLLRDTNPVGRSGTSPGGYNDVYKDTSIVLANRYGKRRV